MAAEAKFEVGDVYKRQVNVSNVTTETCNKCFHLFDYFCSGVVFEFCADNNC